MIISLVQTPPGVILTIINNDVAVEIKIDPKKVINNLEITKINISHDLELFLLNFIYLFINNLYSQGYD